MVDADTKAIPLHRCVAKALSDHGVAVMFGLIGDANLFMVDSFIHEQGGRFIAAAHEASAVLMAHGYAQRAGGIGTATITHGPGLTNAVTALVEAVRSATPLVLLCGDTPVADRDHLQRIDQREIVLASGAGFEAMRAPETALEDVACAFRRAALERRPVVLNMPVEFQWADTAYRRTVFPLRETRAVVPTSDDLDEAVGVIAAAKRPVVLAGRGAAAPEARAALIHLAGRIDAPLATTLRASGLFASEPFNLGVCGTLSSPVATEAILESDCIVAFGAGLNYFTTVRGSLLRGKRLVQVNLHPETIGRTWQPTAGVVGDAALTARRMVDLLDEAEIAGSGYRTDALAEAIAAYRPEPRLLAQPAPAAPGTIDLRQALLRLSAAVPADRNVATDLGRFVGEAWKAFPVLEPAAIIHSVSFGAIGLGLAAAIGAAASGGRPTVLLSGDGGFMMGGLTEFSTAVREGLDLIVVVCNDGSYGAEHRQFTNRAMDPRISLFAWPDFGPIAEAMGARGVTVRDEADLERAAAAITGRQGPVLIDLKLDPTRVPWD